MKTLMTGLRTMKSLKVTMMNPSPPTMKAKTPTPLFLVDIPSLLLLVLLLKTLNEIVGWRSLEKTS